MKSYADQVSWVEEHFREVKETAQVVLDLKYATPDNFMHRNVYNSFHRCFMAPLAFEMFQRACEELKHNHPHLKFKIWDALRPRHVQRAFYEHLRGTPFQNYVAAPEPGSLHNFGLAIDLTLQDQLGNELDMGTGFDDFRDLAQPVLEQKFLNSGELTQKQLDNRLLLRSLMENQGFKVLDHEWWHFNALPKEKVYGNFPILE